jgi:hypothetical protein
MAGPAPCFLYAVVHHRFADRTLLTLSVHLDVVRENRLDVLIPID